ncbi:helix-turn-helix domain-containing protein [Caldilinea sp.]|uniref:AraC family transcriptional regulator n=1 Tax=Caldilinea sp. TaxID=2293560 RepID=UPI002BAB79FF|nr:helix-turn-helix domain-containing protein [Anaerolineales bacterium]HQY94403.1 AraC family transcriptional regulator [Caldilinea sp.]HRA66037.1 AraC family transcriptional regulator [Caldilinea sp.]
MSRSEVISNELSSRRGVKPAAPGSLGLSSWRCQPTLMAMPHQHGDIELNLLLDGMVTYVHREQLVQLAPGCLSIFWGAIPHQLVEAQPACDFCIFTIPLELFLGWKLPDGLVQALLTGELVVDGDAATAQIDRLLLPRWHVELSAGESTVVLKEMEARLWRLAVARQRTPARAGGTVDSRAGRMAHYIVSNYTAPLAIAEIAGAVGLHPTYAMTCFKQTFGVTILEYTMQYRVTQAQRLLMTSDDSVIDIALQSGFGSLSSFYAAFRRYTGRTPKAMRQAAKGAA